MRTLTEHLADRHYDMNTHSAWLNDAERSVAFPLWNLSGQLVGYQRYRPDADKRKKNDPREGRYFTRIKEGKVGVWGLESWSFTNTMFVTEGVFDAARLTSKHVSAIAVLSCDLAQTTKSWLYVVRQLRPVVVVCDGDDSGLKLAKYGHRFYQMQKDVDLGSALQEDVDKLLEDYK